jgi:predicted AlkP superfamily pyrophosphatase or phosphodiesterase
LATEKRRVIVIDLVGLTPSHMADKELTPHLNLLANNGTVSKICPPFPPLTDTVQGSFLTGTEPHRHGNVGNGYYNRISNQIIMWEQKASGLKGRKIWEILKSYNPQAKTAVLFWQNLKYASADIVLTPSPIHDGHTFEQWCFSKPKGLYEAIIKKRGPFPLHNFWGPLASLKSSEWISQAALDIINHVDPNLTLIYLPHLDYQAQRFGPESFQAKESVKELDNLIGNFIATLRKLNKFEDTSIVFISEYAIQPVKKPVLINKILREQGWLKVYTINDKEQLDFYNSNAFAVADHQIAHIYCKNSIVKQVKQFLEKTEGINLVLGESGKLKLKIDHDRAGDLIAIADRDKWFCYYWWETPDAAPHYARTVDIHRKPGYDPGELFIDPITKCIPLEPELIKGSHGYPPCEDKDYVNLLAIGPNHQIFGTKSLWESREIPLILLNLFGYHN